MISFNRIYVDHTDALISKASKKRLIILLRSDEITRGGTIHYLPL